MGDETTDDEERLLDLIDDLRVARATAHRAKRARRSGNSTGNGGEGAKALALHNEVHDLIRRMTDPRPATVQANDGIWKRETA